MIHLWQALLLGLFCFFTTSETVYGGWIGMTIMGKPIITSAICGIIMGDIKTGIIVGCTIQALYIGETIIGGVSSLPSIGLSAWFAIPIAIVAGGTSEMAAQTALTICLACSAIETALRQVNNIVNQAILHVSDAAIHKGNLKMGMLIPYVGCQGVRFLEAMIIIPVMCMLGQDVVIAAVNMLPAWVMGCINCFVRLLPLLGFMILLSVMLKKGSQWLLFLFGFVLIKAAGLNVITVTVIALAVAYLVFLCTGNGSEDESVEGV